MNKVQQAAFDLIREDARFLYVLTGIMRNAKNIDSNYICMSLHLYESSIHRIVCRWGRTMV